MFANAALAELAGLEARSIQGTPMTALFATPDRKRIAQGVARVAEGKAAVSSIEVRLGADGSAERWVQLILQPARDARDQPAGVIAVLRDIEAQRETELALNLSGARLLALAEASPAAVMIENAEGDIELANQPLCTLLAIESAPQSLAGLAARETLARSPLVHADALEEALRLRGQPSALELRMDDGRVVTLERQPIVIDQVDAGAVWSTREEANALPGGSQGAAEIALIEKIGEELSVALEGMSAISIRAQQMEFDPAIVTRFQGIRAATESAMAAIGDLVDFSRLTGGVVLRKSAFGLRSALAELISRVVPNAEEHGCRLRIKVEQDVADSLEGDVERLLLVLKNLLDNAFVLLPGAEIMLQITPEYVTESGIQLSFGVLVSGPGARAGAAKVSAEAGMGVAVARFMVAAMGGKLAVAARAGTDTLYAFAIAFPLRGPPPAPRRATYVSLVGLTGDRGLGRSGAAPRAHQPAARLAHGAPRGRQRPHGDGPARAPRAGRQSPFRS